MFEVGKSKAVHEEVLLSVSHCFDDKLFVVTEEKERATCATCLACLEHVRAVERGTER